MVTEPVEVTEANDYKIKYQMKTFKNYIITGILLLTIQTAFAQSAETVEMADALHQSGKIYVVVGVLSIIFMGIVIYLVSIDLKLSRLEKELKKKN